MNRLLAGIRNLFGGRKTDRDVEAELRAYMAFSADEHERRGLSRTEAERQARVDLGGLAQTREQVGDVRSGHTLEVLWRDIGQAVVQLARAPRFSTMVIVMLALGVGATTALFSVVNGVILRPLDFHDAAELVLVGEVVPQGPSAEELAWFVSPAAFMAWQKEATDFSGLSAMQSTVFTLVGADEPRLVHGVRVSTNFFDLLGVRPQLGRLLTPADATDVADLPMVITDRLWRSVFNADATIIGRRIGLPRGPQGTSATVVGVLPSTFHLEGRELGPMMAGNLTDYFIALHFQPRDFAAGPFNDLNYSVLGRLREGVTLPQALAQVNAIQSTLAASASHDLPLAGEITAVQDYTSVAARKDLWLLMAGALAVLLIVCLNLGGLWLTRLADRRREWAIRIALGAAPGRLARQVLTEGAVLGLLGGGAGVLCAAAGMKALLAAAPAGLPRVSDVHLDWRVFGFGMLLALCAGLLTGLVPALRLSASDPQALLKAHGPATTSDRSSARSREALILLQSAVATLLVTAAGLLGLSFYHLVTRATGFTADRAITADILFNPYDDDMRDRLMSELPAAVTAIPGVTSAAFTSHLPLLGETWIDGAAVPGKVYPIGTTPSVNVRFISPGYLSAIGIPLLSGREFVAQDRPAGWPPKTEKEELAMREVVVISRTAAATLWPGEPPGVIVGRHLIFDGILTPTVIGVAADAHDGSLVSTPPSVIYQPYWQQPPYKVSLVVRTTLTPSAIAAPLRAAVWRLAPDAPIPVLRPLTDLRADAVASERYQLTLLLIFAVVALFLASMGVHAMVANNVAKRRKEMAIRLALGARIGTVRGLVLRQALTPVALGVLFGLIGAVVEGRLLATLLFNVSPSSPAVLASVAVAVLVAALLGWAAPARRAGRTDLVVVLRAE